MMKALIFKNRVVDISQQEFSVVKTMFWINIPENTDVKIGYTYQNGVFSEPVLTEDIEKLRQNKLQELQNAYNIKYASKRFVIGSNKFLASQEIYLGCLSAIVKNIDSRYFITANGLPVLLSLADMTILSDLMENFLERLNAEEVKIQAEIEAFQTAEEIKNYTINFAI